MHSLFDDTIAAQYAHDPLALRVYTSRLLGSDQNLVLHGGGNTSVKIDNLLYVKGSGWDLASIEKEGFPGVDLDVLKEMATRQTLSDTQMVAEQKAAMIDKSAPNPSIEAILHAIIPFTYVDHTHADAVVTITNTPDAKSKLREIYGENMLIIEYVMPGFILAKTIYEQTKDIDWDKLDGIILLNHGVFSFDDDAKKSYEKMIKIVDKASKYLQKHTDIAYTQTTTSPELEQFITPISKLRGKTIIPKMINTPQAYYFSKLPDIKTIIHNGPLTPEHVIRTKAFPAILKDDIKKDLFTYTQAYEAYFNKYAKDEIMLDTAPRWAVIPNQGVVVFGTDEKENTILSDIISHTIDAILRAKQLGSWHSLDKKDIFAMEYWELEQAKLK